MKIGEVIKVNGINLLVLDIFDGNPFVLAYNLSKDMDMPFSTNVESTNNYAKSNLRKKMEKWLKEQDFKVTIGRSVDLTTMDGYDYGSICVKVAPLTFDEFRRYASIIQSKITHDFWLATGWGHDDWAAYFACLVFTDGKPIYSGYNFSIGFAPAFILDKSELTNKKLSNFTTDELLAEIARRTK